MAKHFDYIGDLNSIYADDFEKLNDKLELLPTNANYDSYINNGLDWGISQFLLFTTKLERIVTPDTHLIRNVVYYKLDSETLIADIAAKSDRSGLIFNRCSEHQLTDLENSDFLKSYKILKLAGLEENLKINNKKPLIYFVNNLLVVQLPCAPTAEFIYKLKCLEWTLLKPILTDCNCEALINFYKACTELKLDVMNTLLNELIDFKAIRALEFQKMSTYFTSNKIQLLSSYLRDIEDLKTSTQELENKIRQRYKTLAEKQMIYFNLINEPDNFDINEVMHYLIKHPYIDAIRRYDEKKIILRFLAPITYFDVFLGQQTTKHYTNKQKEVADVLLNPRYTLWTEAEIVFNTTNFNVNNYERTCKEYIPHPHISRYSCFGNHDTSIKKWLETNDYIGAIEQISAAVQNLNFSDAVVLNTLTHDLWNNYAHVKTFYDNETKKFVSIKDILEGEENGKA